MVHEVCGCFETKEEAARVINALSLKGFPADRIKVFTSQTNPVELAKETDGVIMSVGENAEQSLSRIKNMFNKISGSDINIDNQLRQFGLSEQQVEKYTNDIKMGNILVLADNKLKMGHSHSTTDIEFGMESPLVHHNRFHE